MLWFAGAALSQPVFDEMKELAIKTCGERILFLTGLGSTETAPFAMARVWESDNSTNMGLPPPGSELKLVPMEGKLDARVRGPHITPGYWRQPELTAQAFDEEGFYRLGDALKFEDPADPGHGPAVRRPHRGRLQAGERHLGQRRSAARAAGRAFCALREGCCDCRRSTATTSAS